MQGVLFLSRLQEILEIYKACEENRFLIGAVLRIMQGDALDTDLILCYIIDTKRGKRQTVAPIKELVMK